MALDYQDTVRLGDVGAVARLSLLGGFELRCHDDVVNLPTSAQRVVAYVALRQRPQPRNHVGGVLWPDVPEMRATANLRSALWRAHLSDMRLVEVVGSRLRLHPLVKVDVEDLILLAHQLTDSGGDGSCVDSDAIASRLGDELLPDWYEDWLLFERERIHQVRLHALEAWCWALSRMGRHSTAVEAGLCAVEAEPLRETSRRALISAHLAEGNVNEAVRQYESYRRVLAESLDVEPSAELRRLVAGAATS